MRLLKYAVLGAAAVYGFKYATKKRAADGKSLIDDFKEKVPRYVDKIRNYSEKIRQDYRQTSDLY
ncbi:YtxH domain-containing protein [Pedobacter riviphilus]|uniref:YtxH domain-containing protein n=1 Tax=Pedobacter riviphilus TaxID=2766984 RepID=A0ABX6TGM9_9SPHI|nr:MULTISPECIES: YtxH domain-containing protein [Pedobacter]NII85617.1 hypothetical protein [Pedobacter sp. SG908]NMN39466.1 hypothetical protein [Pedobacter sp. SG918]QNR83540.1 YtxH domain-containing protein [Pedobacter riviphilus]